MSADQLHNKGSYHYKPPVTWPVRITIGVSTCVILFLMGSGCWFLFSLAIKGPQVEPRECYVTFRVPEVSGLLAEVKSTEVEDGVLKVTTYDNEDVYIMGGIAVVGWGTMDQIQALRDRMNPQTLQPTSIQRVGPTTAPNSKGIQAIPNTATDEWGQY